MVVLRDLGVRPSRRLGQNFLCDQNTLSFLTRTIDPAAGECILEIGSGAGALTDYLLESDCATLIAVEYDNRLAEYLAGKYGASARFQLIHGDACRINYSKILGDRRFRCVGNLPYAASSAIIFKLLQLENPPHEIFLLVQHEFACRLVAQPRRKTYGSLSVRTQLRYDIDLIRKISPHVFWPVPDVDSAFIRMRPKDRIISSELEDMVGKIARLGFGQRRKQMLSQLLTLADEACIRRSYDVCGLDYRVRAEELQVCQFVALARTMPQS